MTRQQMIEDFYFAVKRYLVNEGRSEVIASAFVYYGYEVIK